jgi:L-ascorbate 6-phosphate lactonase
MPTGQKLLQQIHATPIVPNALALWGLGQLGILVKGPDGILVIDPYLSDDLRERYGEGSTRAYLPPMQPSDLSGISCYLISHEHGDHLDAKTVPVAALASPDMKFVVTGWCVDKMAQVGIAEDRLIIPPVLESILLPGTTARLTAVPSAHYEKEHDSHKGYRWLGYLIEWNGVTFYHSGDTIIYPGYVDTLGQLPTADVAMIPVNGRDWYRESQNLVGNLLPEEAARLALEIGWETVILGHNDMFEANRIPNSHIIDAFDRFAPRQQYKFLQPGELYYYVK